jgi:hypothetical protein
LSDKSVDYKNVTKLSRRIPKSAILAGAAIGLPLAAHADVVFTPLDVTVSSNSSTDATYQFQGPDSVNDFLFTASFQNGADSVTPENSSGYVGTPTNDPTPLGPGALIGPSSTFQTGTGTLQYNPKVFEKGPWNTDAGFQYLGVEFYIGSVNPSDLHYGWISLSACTPGVESPCNDPAVIQINGFAYNTIANGAITTPTPEPSTLPLLALGAAGLAAFRARRKKAA